jgi:hypothetical protein
VQGADQGDTTTIVETPKAAVDQVEAAQADVAEPQPLEEAVVDKGYHSNETMVGLDSVDIRSNIAEPDRGRRDWSKEPEAQAPVYRNLEVASAPSNVSTGCYESVVPLGRPLGRGLEAGRSHASAAGAKVSGHP